MALKDTLLGFFDNIGLKTAYETKPRDAVKARASLLRGIESTKDQFENGRTKVPNKWWSVSNGAVAFSPKLKGVPLVINGQTANFAPQERFLDMLAAFKSAVEAGEFDKEIEQIENGDGNAGSSVSLKVPARKKNSGDKPWTTRTGWDELHPDNKKAISRLYSNGKNPDGSSIAEVGHQPDADYVRKVK